MNFIKPHFEGINGPYLTFVLRYLTEANICSIHMHLGIARSWCGQYSTSKQQKSHCCRERLQFGSIKSLCFKKHSQYRKYL